ncbi:MAG: hypothetical protein ABSA86_13275 [Oryzomonas sp.]|jgi:hypothetical protein
MSHKTSKPPTDKKNPNRHSQAEDQKMNNFAGDIHVTGEIETHIPPKLAEQNRAADVKKQTREDCKLILEIVTVILIALYAGLTALLVCFSFKSLKSTERFAVLDQRPYIHSSGQTSIFPMQDSSVASSAIHIKNFGKSPALNLLRVGQLIGGTSLDDLTKQADAWFRKMGMPLQTEYEANSGMYKMQNGDSVSPDEIMQDDTRILGLTPPIGATVHLPAVAVGRIQYYDMVGNFYWTDFCFVLTTVAGTPGNPATLLPIDCPKHNEIH